MKALFIAFLLLSFLQADEMKRIESIVEDITKLRAEYEECKNSLKSKETLKNDSKVGEYQKQIKKQRQQNIILKAEVDYLNDFSENNEKIIKKYQKLLKTKEKEILALKKKLKISPKRTVKKKIDDNPFPKLMPKENIKQKEEVQITKASTYRLNSDSAIYDSPNAKQINSWTKSTSFTSNIRTINWVKITGFFVDKKWKKAKEEMWIKNSQVSKR